MYWLASMAWPISVIVRVKVNISSESEEFLLTKDLLEGSVALPSGSHEARNHNDRGLAEVNGAVGVQLSRTSSTSQTEIWMEEWSFEVITRSV